MHLRPPTFSASRGLLTHLCDLDIFDDLILPQIYSDYVYARRGPESWATQATGADNTERISGSLALTKS